MLLYCLLTVMDKKLLCLAFYTFSLELAFSQSEMGNTWKAQAESEQQTNARGHGLQSTPNWPPVTSELGQGRSALHELCCVETAQKVPCLLPQHTVPSASERRYRSAILFSKQGTKWHI